MSIIVPQGMGWIPDLPDARDYTYRHEEVLRLLRRLKQTSPSTARHRLFGPGLRLDRTRLGAGPHHPPHVLSSGPWHPVSYSTTCAASRTSLFPGERKSSTEQDLRSLYRPMQRKYLFFASHFSLDDAPLIYIQNLFSFVDSVWGGVQNGGYQ